MRHTAVLTYLWADQPEKQRTIEITGPSAARMTRSPEKHNATRDRHCADLLSVRSIPRPRCAHRAPFGLACTTLRGDRGELKRQELART
jgi:hypothetical protein